ncbi:MAG TPA: hypothetical protein VJL61_05810 [Rhodanobacteraceae bacterium]|nr:hypothetical protein [Rhodanobacteraceae bacterium]
MEYWGPLIQTVLWVALIGWIVVRFHKPIQALLEALTERIRSGSDVTAGPLSVKTPQSATVHEQATRAEQEIEEASAAASGAQPSSPSTATPQPAGQATASPHFRARYFQAEDLALRAVQAEFGQPISRQVSFGPGQQFDGTFVLNNRMNIVEVKYVSKVPPNAIIQQALGRMQAFVEKNNLKSVNLILAAVVDRTSEVDATRKRFTTIADDSNVPTIVRVYSLSELQASFGIIDAG